jgi:hypothetical protein
MRIILSLRGPLRGILVSALLSMSMLMACPDDGPSGEGEGDTSEGEGDPGEGEGDPGEGEGEGDPGEGEGDLGEGEGEGDVGECARPPVCPSAPNGSVVIAGGASPTVTTGGAVITIGQSTRTVVEDGLGVGVAELNGFRVVYCDAGIVVQYVDNDGSLSTTQTAGPVDVVARVLTLNGATASSTSPAMSVGGATAASPGAATSGDVGGVSVYHTTGISALTNAAGSVTSLIAFKPQVSAAAWTLPLTLTDDKSTQSLGSLTPAGQSFAQAEAVLGDAYDAQGEIQVNNFIRLFVRIYASTGIRLAGICNGGCSENTAISQITVSPPFLGTTTGGVGIGSPRTDVEGVVTSTATDGDVTSYGNTSPFGGGGLGVVYIEDSFCVERAAAYVLNYVEAG